MCTCVCVLVSFLPLFVVFSSATATYSNQHCPQFTTWSHALAKATSIQLPPAGTPLGSRHSARVSDIAAFTTNICYSQPLSEGFRYRCLHSKYLLLKAAAHHSPSIAAIHGKYWGSIFSPPHAVLSWFAIIGYCIAVHHSTSTTPSRACNSTGPLLGWPRHN